MSQLQELMEPNSYPFRVSLSQPEPRDRTPLLVGLRECTKKLSDQLDRLEKSNGRYVYTGSPSFTDQWESDKSNRIKKSQLVGSGLAR